MPIRSLTLATLLLAAAPLFAAQSDSPLAQERGKARPLIVIAPSQTDSTLTQLRQELKDPATRDGFTQRNMVLYTIVNTVGERDGKGMDAQSTMALIRELKLGAGGKTRVILIGKDGEKKIETDKVALKDVFSTIDQMPMREKEASAPAPAASAATPAPSEATPKASRPGKGAAPALDD